MTLGSYINRLLRHLKVNSFEALTASQMLELTDSVSYAFNYFFQNAPDRYASRQSSWDLAGPEAISVGVTNASKVISGATTGKTLTIEGHSIFNRVIETNLLQFAYHGSTGTQNANSYSDSITFQNFTIDRLLTDPVLSDGTILKSLKNQIDFTDRSIGKPKYFKFVPFGETVFGSKSSDGFIILDPIPDQAYTVTFNYKIRSFDFSPDLRDPTSYNITPFSLPLDDGLIINYILPISFEYMLMSDLWNKPQLMQNIMQMAIQTKQAISLLSNSTLVPSNSISTPRGF